MTNEDASAPETYKFPGRNQYINDLIKLLNSAKDARGTGRGLRIDAETVYGLANRIIHDEHFEHMHENDVRSALLAALGSCAEIFREGRQPDVRTLANSLVNEWAKPPQDANVYFGVRNLRLPAAIDLHFARLVPSAELGFLEAAVGPEVFSECNVYCIVRESGGTTAHLVDRAQETANRALSLLRAHIRQYFRHVHLIRDQLLYDLHPIYALQSSDGGPAYPGYRRHMTPIETDLGSLPADWSQSLEREGQIIFQLLPGIRSRVEIALDAFAEAATAATWRTQIPPLYSALESILVPETTGRKGEVVTVRAVILQLERRDQFVIPDTLYKGYLLRSHIVHGTPIDKAQIDEAQDTADRLDAQSRSLLGDYLTFASEAGIGRVQKLVARLDESEAGRRACEWFNQIGASEIVEVYRREVGLGV